jgi:hypothetical protein
MQNEFVKVLDKVGHVLDWPFVHAVEVVKVVDTALVDEPKIKLAVTGLLQQIEAVTADGAIAVGTKGLDLPDDIGCVVAAETLFKYVTGTFIPAVDAAFTDVESDLYPAAAPAPTPASTPAIVDPGPGLHTVTAD